LAGDVLEVLISSIFKPSGITWRLGKCDQTMHFQAKWDHLAARKMRPNDALVIRAAEPPARINFYIILKIKQNKMHT
jgi:hypothetical protein